MVYLSKQEWKIQIVILVKVIGEQQLFPVSDLEANTMERLLDGLTLVIEQSVKDHKTILALVKPIVHQLLFNYLSPIFIKIGLFKN
mgnify:CR=1 FL=1|tara:strand:- start:375 stop:632 length:258 start_codon:yes stop_codon:yes gene_type:complete